MTTPVYNQKFVQLDLPHATGRFYVLPKHMPGRVNVDDFVFFHYPHNLNPADYMVAVDTMDTSNPHHTIRTIGDLRGTVDLPAVIFDAYAKIYVIPKNDPMKPSYFARLSRGSTYVIKHYMSPVHMGTKIEMDRRGVLNSGADVSKLAY